MPPDQRDRGTGWRRGAASPDVQRRGEFYHIAPALDAKPFFKITARHYDKLEELFRRQAHPELEGIDSVESGTLGGEGQHSVGGARRRGQSSVPSTHPVVARPIRGSRRARVSGCIESRGLIFDVLLRGLDITFECFASPLNCRYSRFCSAFRDTDAAFGSIGSFFDSEPRQGSFEANPPFVP